MNIAERNKDGNDGDFHGSVGDDDIRTEGDLRTEIEAVDVGRNVNTPDSGNRSGETKTFLGDGRLDGLPERRADTSSESGSVDINIRGNNFIKSLESQLVSDVVVESFSTRGHIATNRA